MKQPSVRMTLNLLLIFGGLIFVIFQLYPTEFSNAQTGACPILDPVIKGTDSSRSMNAWAKGQSVTVIIIQAGSYSYSSAEVEAIKASLASWQSEVVKFFRTQNSLCSF